MLRILLFLAFLQATAVAFAQQLPLPNTKFISPTGSNANPGTRERPLETIQYAVDQAVAGTTIVLLPGIYNERVRIKDKSGSPDRWITIKADKPGTATVTGSAPYESENFLGTFELDGSAYIKISGLEITNNGSNYDTTATIRLAGIEINPSGHHIRIENNDIHSVNRREGTTEEYAYPIIAWSMKDNATSIHHLEIVGNKIHNCITNTGDGKIYCEMIQLLGNIHEALVADNEVYCSQSSGISVAGNYRGSNACDSLSVENDRGRNLVIRNNTFRDMRDYGVYINGAKNILVEQNFIEYCGNGIGVLTETGAIDTTNKCGESLPTEKVWIRNNIVSKSTHSDLVLGMFSTHPTRNFYEPVKDIYVTNNTFWGATPSPGRSVIMLLPGILGQCRLVNNIVVSNGFLLTRNDAVGFDNTATMDYNLWHSVLQNPFRYGSRDTLPPRSFSHHRTHTRQDTNSLFASQTFSFPPLTRNSFRLTRASLAINSGQDNQRPPWYEGFGSYESPVERDHFNECRKKGYIDIGADEHGRHGIFPFFCR